MENYLTYLGLGKYRDIYDVQYVDDGLSEEFRKWANSAKTDTKNPVEKPKETVDAYGNKLNEKGEICW